MGRRDELISSDGVELEEDEWIDSNLNTKKGEKGRSRNPPFKDGSITAMEQKTDRELKVFLIEEIRCTI